MKFKYKSKLKLIKTMSYENDRFNKWTFIKAKGCGPKPSSAHAVVVIKNKLYHYGGMTLINGLNHNNNTLYEFDMDLYFYRKIKIFEDSEIKPRGSFTMSPGLYNDSLIITGGTGLGADTLSNDCLEYNLKEKQLKILHSNEAYTNYYGQTGCRYNNSILIFGGTKGLQYTNAVYELDLLTNKCRLLVTTGESPEPMYKHQSIIIDNKLYVIGGGNYKPETPTVEIYALDLYTLVWNKIASSGTIPVSRVAHTCVFDKESNNIYMWGGFDSQLDRLDDLTSYNIITKEWNEIIIDSNEESPKRKAFHSSIFYNGAIYLFGGSDGDHSCNDIWKYEIRSTPPTLGVLCARIIKKNNMDDLIKTNIQDVITGVKQMNKYAAKLGC